MLHIHTLINTLHSAYGKSVRVADNKHQHITALSLRVLDDAMVPACCDLYKSQRKKLNGPVLVSQKVVVKKELTSCELDEVEEANDDITWQVI